MEDGERQHLEELRHRHQQRLRELEIQEANFGMSTPPHISNEIRDIRAKISDIDTKIARLTGDNHKHISGNNTDVFNAGQFAKASKARNYLRMLVVLAAPIASKSDDRHQNHPLDVQREWEQLRRATDRAHDPGNSISAPWAVVRLVPPTLQCLRDALIPRNPGYQVIHISCRGTSDSLIFEDNFGRVSEVKKADLVGAIRGNSNRSVAQLVFLNGGNTIDLAQRLYNDAWVPFVVATKHVVPPKNCTTREVSLSLARGRQA